MRTEEATMEGERVKLGGRRRGDPMPQILMPLMTLLRVGLLGWVFLLCYQCA